MASTRRYKNMRYGQRGSDARWGHRWALRVVALATVVVALFAGTLGAGAVGASGPGAPDSETWAVTEAPDGSLDVIRGPDVGEAIVDELTGRSAVKVVTTEESRPVRALVEPRRAEQWALNAVPYEATWPVANGSGVTVAVVDTGIAATHEDLFGAVVPGTDLSDDEATYDPAGLGMVDPGGHGTHVAGIIAARASNGVGIAGAAPGAKVMPVRVLDAFGLGSTENVAEGIIWAVDHGARVVNLSLGSGDPSPGIRTAVQYAISKNAVVVAAGGNGYLAGNVPVYPAAYSEPIAVAAVTSSLTRASFSNTGGYIDVAAPGNSILSTFGGASANAYQFLSGTSMATPYVSAVAAIVISKTPGASASQVRQAIESTTTDLGPAGRDNSFGRGLVNPQRAVLTIAGLPPTAATLLAQQSSFNCALQSKANGKYVSAELGYGGPSYGLLRARAGTAGSWEQFRCEALGNNQWAIRSRANNAYVAAELGYAGSSNGALRARSGSVGSWERFELVAVDLDKSVFALRSSASGLYGSAELGYGDSLYAMVRARGTAANSWEQFTVRINGS